MIGHHSRKSHPHQPNNPLTSIRPIFTFYKNSSLGLHENTLKPLLRYLFLAFGCLHLVGGPYSLMQAYAWVNMIIDYSKETGISQAVTDTFSGEKPCCLCKQIASAKASESQRDSQNTPLSPSGSKPIEHLFPPPVIPLLSPHHIPYLQPEFMQVAQSASLLGSGPPSPPPKC